MNMEQYLNLQDWYCEDCDAWLNLQTGFTTKKGVWRCKCCGFDNTVTEDTIEYNHSFLYECPKCQGHVRRSTEYAAWNIWVCEDCNTICEEKEGLLWYRE